MVNSADAATCGLGGGVTSQKWAEMAVQSLRSELQVEIIRRVDGVGSNPSTKVRITGNIHLVTAAAYSGVLHLHVDQTWSATSPTRASSSSTGLGVPEPDTGTADWLHEMPSPWPTRLRSSISTIRFTLNAATRENERDIMTDVQTSTGDESHTHEPRTHSHWHLHVTHNRNPETGGIEHHSFSHEHEHHHAHLFHTHVPHQDFDKEHAGEAHTHDHDASSAEARDLGGG